MVWLRCGGGGLFVSRTRVLSGSGPASMAAGRATDSHVGSGLVPLLCVPVCRRIVEYDQDAGRKDLTDVGRESQTVHCAFDDPRCDENVPCQTMPRLARPHRRVRFGFTAVSSIKTARSGKAEMAGSRCLNQSACRCLTLTRRRSAAASAFFGDCIFEKPVFLSDPATAW